jgi:hypothetical protein
MSVNLSQKKSEYYSNKKYKVDILDELKGLSELKDSIIDVFKEDLKRGFSLYTKRNLLRFLQCEDDITDIAEQFIKLDEYYKNNNKYSNSEELYCILYGEKVGLAKWAEKIEKVKGENNPWYNHAGKFSPFKKDSVNYSKDAVENAIRNRQYNTKIDYYINKGYSETEAKALLKERQTTFSLKKCIKEYGEEEGTKLWKERQEKWQNTLKSKSQDELDDINKRKSSGIGRYLDRNIPGMLYYIHFYTDQIEFWKIGITSRTINERFNISLLENKHNIHCDVLFVNKYKTIQQAYEEEQYILNTFNKNRIMINIDGFYTTEAFDKNVLKGFFNEDI